MLNIVADEAIPLVGELFSPSANVIRIPQEQITQATLARMDAKVLLVRSVIPVNVTLLHDTPVEWVGTASAGIDHLDIQWLAEHGITWAHAPGANARAVAEYAVSCIAWLQLHPDLFNNLPMTDWTAGVIGAGQVGRHFIQFLKDMGVRVLIYDPPRQEREPDFESTPLSEWPHCDLVSLHVPLTKEGPHATYHLVDERFLRQQTKGVLLNTSRGEVIDVSALLRSPQIVPCIDVWPHEPTIDHELLARARIATPHIAGYGRDAKDTATRMLYEKWVQHYPNYVIPHEQERPTTVKETFRFLPVQDCAHWQQVVLKVYNPATDTCQLKASSTSADFTRLRKNYVLRDAFSTIALLGTEHLSAYDHDVLVKLGFNFEQLRIS